MIVKSAAFFTGAVKPHQYPPPDLPEIAFAGRSNVGKSSLINTLLDRKRLVKTSSTPGRTREINFFIVNNSFYFVDLPGYGYARVPTALRKTWGPMVETYLAKRSSLKGVVLIMDLRRLPGEVEKDFIAWLKRQGLKSLLILTKADKLSKTKQLNQQKAIAAHLALEPDDLILFSAKNRKGRETVWQAIETLL